jgi:hypothetical protein
MSIPSITLRLDFGDAGKSGATEGISVQGDVPTPTGFTSNLTGLAQTPVPTPMLTAGQTGAHETVPTPMSGIGGNVATALVATPEPSLDLTAVGGPGAGDVAPHPEGEPTSVKNKPAGTK